MSALRQALTDYLAMRRALGYKLDKTEPRSSTKDSKRLAAGAHYVKLLWVSGFGLWQSHRTGGVFREALLINLSVIYAADAAFVVSSSTPIDSMPRLSLGL